MDELLFSSCAESCVIKCCPRAQGTVAHFFLRVCNVPCSAPILGGLGRVGSLLVFSRCLQLPWLGTHMQTICVAEGGSLLLVLTGVCVTGQTTDVVGDAESRAMARL